MQKPNILIISGPTGVGESTITNEIIKKIPKFQKLIAATSRPLRSNEKSTDYYFFSKEEFENEISKGNIVEYTYMENRDTSYGTYKPELEKKLTTGYVIANVDYVGTEYLKKHYDALAIFIKPESIDALESRLKGRNPDITDSELAKRLENAKNEIENEEKYYDETVINRDGKLDEAVAEVENILKKNGFVF